jgi:hypothetical protein
MVQGLQGRYLLPVAPLVAWLLPTIVRPRIVALAAPAWLAVAAFPMVTLIVMPWRVIARYYSS